MAMVLTTITAKVPLPTGAVPGSGYLKFQLEGWDKSAEFLFPPVPYVVAISTDGTVEIALQSTDQSDIGWLYRVWFGCTIIEKTRAVCVDLGVVSVPATGPCALSDLLAFPGSSPNIPDALAQALAASAGAAGHASAAALSADAAADSADAAADRAEAAADSAAAAALFDPGFYQPADALLTEIATEGTVIPLSSAGQALIQAADSAAQLTLLGVSAAGKAMIQAANSAAQLTLLTPPCLIVQDVKAAGVDGGTFTAGAWRTRDLNTVKTNTIPGASLGSNRVTLPSGVYRVHATAPAHRTNGDKIRLQQITPEAATLLEGTAAYSGNVAYNTCSVSQIVGRFTLAATATIELQHWGVTTSSGIGFGIAAPTGSSIYSQIVIERIGNA